MFYVLLPLLVTVIGALFYALATSPKAAEMGRIAFAAGLAVSLFYLTRYGVKLL